MYAVFCLGGASSRHRYLADKLDQTDSQNHRTIRSLIRHQEAKQLSVFSEAGHFLAVETALSNWESCKMPAVKQPALAVPKQTNVPQRRSVASLSSDQLDYEAIIVIEV